MAYPRFCPYQNWCIIMKNSYKLGMKIGYFGYDKGALIPVVYLDWFKRYQEDTSECEHTTCNRDQTAIIPYVLFSGTVSML